MERWRDAAEPELETLLAGEWLYLGGVIKREVELVELTLDVDRLCESTGVGAVLACLGKATALWNLAGGAYASVETTEAFSKR